MIDELLKTYDDFGTVVSPLMRSEIGEQKEPKTFFPAISAIWVVNISGQLLCSQRSLSVKNYPGLWQTFFGGHVKEGSDFLQTAIDELYEEAGIVATADRLHKITSGRTKYGTYCEGYVFLFNFDQDKISFVDGEVMNTRWMHFDEYNTELAAQTEIWCNGCGKDEQLKIKEWLKI